ncbi:hypothetical protein Hanom_Chr13g01235441 [Helianthus anomalus]
MSPKVRTRHGEVTAELAWSGSGSRSEITSAVGRTVNYPHIWTLKLNSVFNGFLDLILQ